MACMRVSGGFQALRAGAGLALMVFLGVSCARFNPPERVAGGGGLPAAFTLYDEAAPAPDRWWEVFGSEELNLFVGEALGGNLTLAQAYARLTQAEMVARQAAAVRYPALSFSGDVSTSRRRTDTGASRDYAEAATQKIEALDALLGAVQPDNPAGALGAAESVLRSGQKLFSEIPSPSARTTAHSYRFGLSSVYEMDLWGRLRAQERAALLDYEASREDLYAAMLSLSGLAVRQWLVIVAQRQGLGLISEQLALNKTTLELMELRYRKGLASALDVFQQRQIVAQTESLVPPLEQALQTATHELAVLLGKPPRVELPVVTARLPNAGKFPDPGVPADLLARRPDVRAAGLDLQAADWRFAAARADRLPSFRLTASGSFGAEEWALVFDNWAATLAASLTGPIFDAGRRKAEVERTRALAEERLARYRERVLQALKEVENALFQQAKQGEYIAALEREIGVLRQTHSQAQQRYRKGLNDYLPVLSALTQLQVLERRWVAAVFERLNGRVALYLALGGSWMADAAGAGNTPNFESAAAKSESG